MKFLKILPSAILGAIVGMIIANVWSYQISPLYNSCYSFIFGNTITFKTNMGRTIKVIADDYTNYMSKPGEEPYVVSCTPEAESVELANTIYEPQNSYLNMIKHIVERNSSRLRYYEIENPKNPQILICIPTQDCKKLAISHLKE